MDKFIKLTYVVIAINIGKLIYSIVPDEFQYYFATLFGMLLVRGLLFLIEKLK